MRRERGRDIFQKTVVKSVKIQYNLLYMLQSKTRGTVDAVLLTVKEKRNYGC